VQEPESADLHAKLEALLFAVSEPVPFEALAEVLGVPLEVIHSTLKELALEYERPERGFLLDQVAGGVRLVTKPQYAGLVEQLLRPLRTTGLTVAALETLAIVAYKQPVTRAEIEAVRGVKADSALATLLERRLVAEAGRKDAPGRPILYVTTQEFLTAFGLNSLADLPPLAEPSTKN